MTDILTLGEVLIDLTEKGSDENGNKKFIAYPGGAPANVAVAASKLGAKTAFIGKVGNDSFGHKLEEVLKAENVDTKGLYLSDEYQTTLAIVAVGESGEREFSFYRSPGADTQLTEYEAIAAMDHAPVILHVGSLSLTDSPAKEACMTAVKHAKEHGSVISYDPNYRPALWKNEEEAVEAMKSLLPYADIIKVAEEELVLLTGTMDLEQGSRIFADQGARLVIVTLGGNGVFVRYGGYTAKVPGVKTTVADTNGAGDTFLGAMLAKLSSRANDASDKDILDDIDTDVLCGYVMYANRAAALTCSRPGAIPAMPTAEELAE